MNVTDDGVARRQSALHGTALVRQFHRLFGLLLIALVLDYKFDLMYTKRAFVHWYVGEGMEEVRAQSVHVCAFDLVLFLVG